MQRTSNKHGSRLDDELKHETEPLERSGGESHVEEHLAKEAPGDYEPDPGVAHVEGAAWAALGPDPVTARRELSRHLPPGVFPAEREALLDLVAREGAPLQVRDALAALPPGVTLANVYDVWNALGGPIDEPPRGEESRLG